jgi:hypothetical protein
MKQSSTPSSSDTYGEQEDVDADVVLDDPTEKFISHPESFDDVRDAVEHNPSFFNWAILLISLQWSSLMLQSSDP